MSRLDRDIAAVQAALARTEAKLAGMLEALGPDQCPCCAGAAYGGTDGPYDRLGRKQDRQEAWLRVLLARRSGDAQERAKAFTAYGELTKPRPDR